MSATPLLIVWPEYPPAVGGMQVHGFEFARFLREAAIPFVLVTRRPATPERARDAALFDSASGIPAQRILPPDDFADALQTLRRLARSLRPRAVFSSQVAYAPAFEGIARVVCRSAGNDILRPWIGPCDVSHRAMRSIPEAQRAARVRANVEWVRRASAACDAVLCNSDWTAARVRQMLNATVTVVRGGVDVRRFRPLPRDRFRVHLPWTRDCALAVIAGRHVLKKGIDVALDAMAMLGPDVKLMIAGSGPETGTLWAQRNRLDLADRVRFVGPVEHATLPWLLAMADVVLTPSRSVYDPRRFATDHETMCRVACEAAACGTPVVASNSGGLPEVVRHGETGLLVEAGDPAALAAGIRAIAADATLRTALSRQAREWAVSDLSFDKVNRITLAHIDTPPETRPPVLDEPVHRHGYRRSDSLQSL